MNYPHSSLPVTKHDREDYGSTRLKWFLYGMLAGVIVTSALYQLYPKVEMITVTEYRLVDKIVYGDTPNWCRRDPVPYCKGVLKIQ